MLNEKHVIQKLRNQVINDTKNKFKEVGIFNLNDSIIEDLTWHNLDRLWHGEDKAWVCVKNCNG